MALRILDSNKPLGTPRDPATRKNIDENNADMFETQKKSVAATKIQKIVRGNSVRKEILGPTQLFKAIEQVYLS